MEFSRLYRNREQIGYPRVPLIISSARKYGEQPRTYDSRVVCFRPFRDVLSAITESFIGK